MKKLIVIIVTVLLTTMVFGCNNNEQFDLNNFGFENNNGMNKWIEITNYDFEKGYAEFSNKNDIQYFLDFKENVVISTFLTYKQTESQKETLQLFEKLDNNTAVIDQKPIYIKKRIVQNNMLVIEVLRNSENAFFVLQDMVDIVDSGESTKYYFK